MGAGREASTADGPGDSVAGAPVDFRSLDQPWRRCVELAWDSWVAGSVPVGAVVVDGDGCVVSEGRSRAFEEAAPPGQLAGSYLAHAEVNAMLSLPRGDHSHLTVYTSLEPCLLCRVAAMYAHVGLVRYAAPDPVWLGIDGVTALNDHVRHNWRALEGPLDGPVAAWCQLLHVLHALRHKPEGRVVKVHRRHSPALLDLAVDIHTSGTLDRLTPNGMPRAMRELWPRLVELTDVRPTDAGARRWTG